MKQRFERRAAGHSTWFGKVDDDPHSSVIIVEVDGLVAGSVFAHGKHYSIRGKDAASQEVVEVEQSAFPPEACDQPPAGDQLQSLSAPSAFPEAQADTGSGIDVMVVYTPAALARQGSAAAIEATINVAVGETNVSYANSGIATSLRLVRTEQVAYTETAAPNGYETDLARLQNPGDGYMDEVHTLRNTYNADVVVLLVDALSTYNVCGYAYIAGTESYAFALVDQHCATINYSFGHEIGHIQGARHDWYVDSTNNSPFTYNHGHVDPSILRRTIMAYNDECTATIPPPNDNNCIRVQYFSKPGLAYPGYDASHPMGSSIENNTLALNTTAAAVANFRQSAPAVVTLSVRSANPATGIGIAVSPTDNNFQGNGTTSFTRSYYENTTVTLTAPATEPLNGIPLQGWSGCTSVSGYPVQNVCTVTLSGSKTVTANYYPNNLTVTSSYPAEGVEITVVPQDLAGRSVGTTSFARSYLSGTTVTLTAPAKDPLYDLYDLAGWSGCTSVSEPGKVCTVIISGSKTVTANYNPGNYPPALNAISNRTINEDAGEQTVSLSGIADGPDATQQKLTVTAHSSNQALIPDDPVNPGDPDPLRVVYTSPNSTGSVRFKPAANAHGAAEITVTVKDDGGGFYDTVERKFLVTVNAVNDLPTLDLIGDVVRGKNAGTKEVALDRFDGRA